MLNSDVPSVKFGRGVFEILAEMTSYILNTLKIRLTQITADTANAVLCSQRVLDASVQRLILTPCSSSWETVNYPADIFLQSSSCVSLIS
jgi:hypothetical protein